MNNTIAKRRRLVLPAVLTLALLGALDIVSFGRAASAPGHEASNAEGRPDEGSPQAQIETPDSLGPESLGTVQVLPGATDRASPHVLLQTVLETSRAEFDKGIAIYAGHLESSGEDYARLRREFILPMLNALKILLGNGVASEDAPPALPAVNMFDAPQDSPEYEALVKKHEEEMEAHSRAILLLELWNWRVVLMQNVVGYYSQPPYATDELRQLATEVLQDDAVVNALVQKVAANIALQNAIASQLLLQTVLETSRAEFDKGTAIYAGHLESSGEDYARLRREFILPMLNALKILLGNGVASEDAPPALPAVNMFDAPQDSPEYEALVKKHEEEMEAHSRAILLLELWNWRVVLMQNVVGYYSQPPYATDELRQLATEVLQDDAVVNTLVQKVEANIAWNTAFQP